VADDHAKLRREAGAGVDEPGHCGRERASSLGPGGAC
jgi:hypothetical protein